MTAHHYRTVRRASSALVERHVMSAKCPSFALIGSRIRTLAHHRPVPKDATAQRRAMAASVNYVHGSGEFAAEFKRHLSSHALGMASHPFYVRRMHMQVLEHGHTSSLSVCQCTLMTRSVGHRCVYATTTHCNTADTAHDVHKHMVC
mmetsp:Transcript_14241/g.32334  ORF Transcript_14241/g.32334 Transcript_14241/m.32334 type:complete len:147 (-) Transcript_14241:399-839(-)